MSIAMVGPGSVGAFFAAQLEAAGQPVLACARRPFNEYVIESPDWPVTIAANVITDPSAVAGPVDTVLFCVKAHQSAAAKPWLDMLCHGNTNVVVIQNGIEHLERVEPLVARGQVIPSIVYCAAELVAPGHVVHSDSAILHMPALPGAADVGALFVNTPCKVAPTERYLTEAWTKLGSNCLLNGVMALTDQAMELYQKPQLAELGHALLTEAWTVARADGADIDLTRIPQLIAMIASRVGKVTSMLQDRRAGRPTEHDALYGAVVRAGERLGIPTPLHRTIDALLSAWDMT
jgi:2-dehydropantoate 2-reductase